MSKFDFAMILIAGSLFVLGLLLGAAMVTTIPERYTSLPSPTAIPNMTITYFDSDFQKCHNCPEIVNVSVTTKYGNVVQITLPVSALGNSPCKQEVRSTPTGLTKEQIMEISKL